MAKRVTQTVKYPNKSVESTFETSFACVVKLQNTDERQKRHCKVCGKQRNGRADGKRKQCFAEQVKLASLRVLLGLDITALRVHSIAMLH